MSESKRVRGNIGERGKRRFVTRTNILGLTRTKSDKICMIDRWELPLRGSKTYWEKICNDIESKVLTKVRNSSSSNPFSYPIISPPSFRYSTASSVSNDDKNVNSFSKNNLTTKIVNSTVPKRILKAPQTSKPPHDSITTINELSHENIKFPSELFDDFNDHSESSMNRLTKLSKITRLVNDFLANTRPRVRPTSLKSKKFSSPRTRLSPNDRNRKSVVTREKSINARSKEDLSEYAPSIPKNSPEETKEEVSNIEEATLKKRSVGFRDDLEKSLRQSSDEKEDLITAPKPIRTRAPSLSIASALPSFGKVVISIEDIDSTENEEDRKDNDWNSPDVVKSKDYRKTIGLDEPDINDPKSKQNFLRVPEVRPTGSASYPSHDKSNYPQENVLNETQQAEEVYESELLKESRILRKNLSHWPKRSLVHVFRALKTMKNGLRSKARIESETNRFFAAPLDVYSPSMRSSISSEDRTDFMDANVPESELNDETIVMQKNDRNGTLEKNDGESDSSSYASVRERLMRNALAHLPKDSQRYAPGTCIDTDNVLEVTSGAANLSSFNNSWATSVNEVVAKPPNRKSLERHFVGIPRVARIFQRVKGDKCLACMCRSLGDIDQTKQHKSKGTFLDDGDEVRLNDDETSQILGYDFSTNRTFDHFYRVKPPFSSDKSLTSDRLSRPLIADGNSPKFTKEPESLIEQSSIGTSKTADDSHRSGTIVESRSKPLISAKSLITSLSLVSERSRSISDQDDSDQGCTDPVNNDITLEGGSNSKNLAPCHRPINLKPSLAPLKALRNKKSRSIRSRVASAEKSVDSAEEDDEDSNYGEKISKQLVNVANNKLTTGEDSMKLGIVGSLGDNLEEIGKIEDDPGEKKLDGDEMQSTIESHTVSNKIDDVKNDFPDLPIISDREVIEISTKCLEENMTINEILRVLAKEYSKRLSERLSSENRSKRSTNARKNEKIAINLLTLLVDSKNYLNREKRSNEYSDLSFSSKQPGLPNSRHLRRILPLKSYNLVAPILGMSKWYPVRKMSSLRGSRRIFSRMNRDDKSKEIDYDLMVHPPSRVGDKVSFEKSWEERCPQLSPYALFMMKPRRKAVTWRPLTERDAEGYDPEATLKMRAAKITDRICEDFCQWLESLAAGTNQTSSIDVDVLKDMFETDFTAEVCSTMQVAIREMPMVPIAVAIARNCPNAGYLALTRKYLVKDAKAEMRPKETIGFGTSLPNRFKFIPPRNKVEDRWLQCENVPKDLETMDAVWKDITHLPSVKGFINWLRAHPEVTPPEALEKVLTTREILSARQSVLNRFKHLELELDQIQNLKVGDNAPDAY